MVIGVGIGSSENAILDYLCLGYYFFEWFQIIFVDLKFQSIMCYVKL
jgi:hypothetical protein